MEKYRVISNSISSFLQEEMNKTCDDGYKFLSLSTCMEETGSLSGRSSVKYTVVMELDEAKKKA